MRPVVEGMSESVGGLPTRSGDSLGDKVGRPCTVAMRAMRAKKRARIEACIFGLEWWLRGAEVLELIRSLWYIG